MPENYWVSQGMNFHPTYRSYINQTPVITGDFGPTLLNFPQPGYQLSPAPMDPGVYQTPKFKERNSASWLA